MERINTFSTEILERYPALKSDASRRIVFTTGKDAHLPQAYAYEGAAMIPVPVFRWQLGQRIDQRLIDLQMPLLEQLLQHAPKQFVQLEAEEARLIVAPVTKLPKLPEADIVCLAVWADHLTASKHRVFMMERAEPTQLDCVLEKPDAETLRSMSATHLSLMDTGIHLLTQAAAKALEEKQLDELINDFRISVIPLDNGAYYDFSTTETMIESTMALQNIVQDQRLIIQNNLPKHPSLFTQNARIARPLTSENGDIWIENAYVPETWRLKSRHVVTGVPKNNWEVQLEPGQCVSMLPCGETGYGVCVYIYKEEYSLSNGQGLTYWLCADETMLHEVLQVLLQGKEPNVPQKSLAELNVNRERLEQGRRALTKECLRKIQENYAKSVFYQVDLGDMVRQYTDLQLEMPAPVEEDAAMMTRIRDAMFRAQLHKVRGEDGTAEEQRAFALLREGLMQTAYSQRQEPQLDVYPDQIVWGRSSVRIDIAGGWTDTPPYCMNTGGSVVNLAIELNGQQPLQVYVKPCKEPKIVCRSIDLSAEEVIETYDELALFNKVGSPFSIPKAALALCGFLPQFAKRPAQTLRKQLENFGCGIEITLLSAIPAGSGLGTSSILAATVLGALSDFCGLGWDKMTICDRTLLLEQLLTTGGGWQDQYGGVLHGVKLLQSGRGFTQTPVARWLPDQIWNEPENRQCHLLYYTGLTRTAKTILADIVRGMFLNSNEHLSILAAMKQQALDMFDAIQRSNMAAYGQLVRKTWQQNKALDKGTEPPLVAALCQKIDDLCSGYKLPGAGGGGYLYMVAKDPEAAARIKSLLTAEPLSPSARFVDMRLSKKGLQVSRS